MYCSNEVIYSSYWYWYVHNGDYNNLDTNIKCYLAMQNCCRKEKRYVAMQNCCRKEKRYVAMQNCCGKELYKPETYIHIHIHMLYFDVYNLDYAFIYIHHNNTHNYIVTY